MHVAVRELRPGDHDAIGRVFVEAAQAAWAHFIPSEGLAGLVPPERWKRETVLVSESDGAGVVGFAVLRPSDDADADASTGELDLIYTTPSVWGRGTGRALMAAALDWFRGEGYRQATLWTAEPNERPRRFYEMAGWRVDGTRRTKTALGATFIECRYRITL